MRDKLKEIEAIEEEVDQLRGAILSYLGQLRKEPLSDQQSARQIKLISISPEMRKTLDTVQEKVNHTLLDAVNSVRRSDAAEAQAVINAKRELNALIDAVLAHQAQRLALQDGNRLRVFRYEMEWVESLKRVYTLAKRMAKVELRNSASEEESQSIAS